MKVGEVSEGAPAEAASPVPAQAAQGNVVYITAKDGRRFGLKKLKPSARYLVTENCQIVNPLVELQAVVVATVFSIGDEVYPALKSKADLLRRLDEIDDSLRDITPAVMDLYGLTEKDVELAKN